MLSTRAWRIRSLERFACRNRGMGFRKTLSLARAERVGIAGCPAVPLVPEHLSLAYHLLDGYQSGPPPTILTGFGYSRRFMVLTHSTRRALNPRFSRPANADLIRPREKFVSESPWNSRRIQDGAIMGQAAGHTHSSRGIQPGRSDAEFSQNQRSRIPVYRGTRTTILGFVQYQGHDNRSLLDRGTPPRENFQPPPFACARFTRSASCHETKPASECSRVAHHHCLHGPGGERIWHSSSGW